jgi:hypothetical protein
LPDQGTYGNLFQNVEQSIQLNVLFFQCSNSGTGSLPAALVKLQNFQIGWKLAITKYESLAAFALLTFEF